MKSVHVFILISLFLCAFAASVVEAGFGCPFNQYECHNHCKGIRGYKGGYCTNLLKVTCKCYK